MPNINVIWYPTETKEVISTQSEIRWKSDNLELNVIKILKTIKNAQKKLNLHKDLLVI